MSRAAQAESKQFRRQCEFCRERKARFRYRGVVKADRDHTLCFECYRSERDSRRARLLAQVSPVPLGHWRRSNSVRTGLSQPRSTIAS